METVLSLILLILFATYLVCILDHEAEEKAHEEYLQREEEFELRRIKP